MNSAKIKPGFVLIIDDDLEVRESLVDLFKRTDWETVCRSSAVGVKQELALLSVDVIVTDVRMPEISGLELLRHWKRRTGHLLF